MTCMPTAERRPGRPRYRPSSTTAAGRDQILDAAAELFVEYGVGGTSTRMIAERVGVRQASLYYHFAGKDEILAELLSGSVRPSLEAVQALVARVPGEVDPAAGLHALAVIDVRTLAASPHNVGTLYLLPELRHERFDSFRAERTELRRIYGRLGAAAATATVLALGEERLGELLMQLVEVVIQVRRERILTTADEAAVADSCLRLCGLDEEAVAAARAPAAALL
jgi:AcrR family transcriptional regulator